MILVGPRCNQRGVGGEVRTIDMILPGTAVTENSEKRIVRRLLQIGAPRKMPVGANAKDSRLNVVSHAIGARSIFVMQLEGDLASPARIVEERLVAEE